MSYCQTHGTYSTTSDQCPQCGSHARLVERPAPQVFPLGNATVTVGLEWSQVWREVEWAAKGFNLSPQTVAKALLELRERVDGLVRAGLR